MQATSIMRISSKFLKARKRIELANVVNSNLVAWQSQIYFDPNYKNTIKRLTLLIFTLEG